MKKPSDVLRGFREDGTLIVLDGYGGKILSELPLKGETLKATSKSKPWKGKKDRKPPIERTDALLKLELNFQLSERAARERSTELLKNYKIFCKKILNNESQGGWEYLEYLKTVPPFVPWLNNDPSSVSLVGPLERVTETLYHSRTLKGMSTSISYTGISGEMAPLKVHLSLLKSCVGLDPHKGGRILVLNGSLLVSNSWFTDREGLLMLLAGGGKAYGLSGTGIYRRDVRAGLYSWTVRGQISEEMNLKACTGFRSSDMTIGEAQDLLTSNSSNFLGREIDYVTSSLRSAVDMFKYNSNRKEVKSYSVGGWNHTLRTSGSFPADLSVRSKFESSDGLLSIVDDNVKIRTEQLKDSLHVTMQYSDQVFRLKYSNCRRVIDPSDPFYDFTVAPTLLQTRPWNSIEDSLLARTVSKLAAGGGVYSKTTGTGFKKKYKSLAELGIRSFIKDVVNNRNGVSLERFKGYSDIVDFINQWLFYNRIKVGRVIDISYISNVKYLSRGKLPKRKTLPDVPVIRSFLLYVKSRFCNYDPSVLLVEDKRPVTQSEIDNYKESSNGKYEAGRTKFHEKTYFNVWSFLDVATERADE